MSQVRMNVQLLEDKILNENFIRILLGNEKDERFTFSSEFILALEVKKQDAVNFLGEALQKQGFIVVAENPSMLLAKDSNITAILRFSQRNKYCTVYVQYWAPDLRVKDDFSKWVHGLFTGKLIKGNICGLRWLYTSKHGLTSTYIEEILSDVVYEEAYPSVVRKYGSLEGFAKTYLESDESVLVLQGPPGTGKSRLIRYLMSKLVELKKLDIDADDEYGYESTRSGKSLVLYTSDTETMKGDELFATFMTSDEIMFVVEDADNMLRSRASGNDHLHRFLTVSDGIIRNIGRKVVFTTNLPNITDIDDALIRPGRCFAGLSLGGLNVEDGRKLALRLSGQNTNVVEPVEALYKTHKTLTLAEIYKTWKSLSK